MTDTTRADIERYTATFTGRARDDVLPYWRRTTADRRYGGYRVRDFGSERFARVHRWRARQHAHKQAMAQVRLVWTFSHATRTGLTDGSGAELDAAGRGCRFLVDHFWDDQFGGWRWETERSGAPFDERKNLYAQVSAIFALVEYARAAEDAAWLQRALDTYHVIEAHLHDDEFGGWDENRSRDWGPIEAADRPMVEPIGVKSANLTLHVMESYAELADATGDVRVGASLEEAIDVLRRYFVPDDPAGWCMFRHPDWGPVDHEEGNIVSYGHVVESAWLLLRAEHVAGREPSWDSFFSLVDHVLSSGYDHRRGGLFTGGPPTGEATQRQKVWWCQAELVAALVDAAACRPGSGYERPLRDTLAFVDAHVADPMDGVWFEAVAEDGAVVTRTKAHDWQSSYHDVRTIAKLAAAYR